LKEADEKDLSVVITCTQRSPEEQEALYAQGRENLLVVNKKREALGMVRLKAASNRKVTWTLKSYHTCEPKSMAFDFAVGSKSKIYWDLKADVNDNEIPDYEEFAKICKSKNPNIEWGGDFKKSKDCPHIQWKNGMTINQDEVIAKIEEKEEKKPLGGFTKCLKKVKGSILKSFRRK